MQAERRAAQIDSSLQPCHGSNLPSDKVGTSMTPPPSPPLAVAKTHLRTRPDCLFPEAELQQSGIKWKSENEVIISLSDWEQSQLELSKPFFKSVYTCASFAFISSTALSQHLVRVASKIESFQYFK